jgi:alanine racemase
MTDHTRATSLLTVDVGAIVANWRLISRRAAPAEAAAVVKADCYGLGAEHIVPALAAAGCRSFFVATIDEGIAVRKLVGDGMIYVLCGPLPGSEPEFAAHRLIPVLNSLSQITGWSGFAHANSAAPPAALHMDTGMTRLGLDESDLGRLASHEGVLAGIRPVLLMSHLARAEETGTDMNTRQRDAFVRHSLTLPAMPRSLSASSGVFLGPDFAFDMVRPGASLYGLNPTPDQPNPMAQVVRLQGKILQVRDVDSPMTVGYGATHQIVRRGRIATVAVGYADGYFRSLGNRGYGMIEGVKVPVVGRVSMDLTTFDVSDVPSALAHPGAAIDLIGPGHDADALATEAGTIGYEILTALGRRHARTYLTSSAAAGAASRGGLQP